MNRDYPTEVPVDEMMLRKCSYGAGMKEFTLIKPEHLLNGECFYAEKYPKGKATAHWAVKKSCSIKNNVEITAALDSLLNRAIEAKRTYSEKVELDQQENNKKNKL